VKTGLITSSTYQNHNTGNGHPEKIDRVTAIIDNFKKLNNKNLIWKKPLRKGIDLWKKTVLFMIVQERKKMKISSALFVAAQSGVQIVNLLKIAVLNLYRHCVYVKNANN